MNVEFLLLIVDYFKIIRLRDLLTDVLIPILIVTVFYTVNLEEAHLASMLSSLSSNSISLLGILVGFSIAVITLLITANTKNIEEIKGKIVLQLNDYRNISLFDSLIITYTYSVIIEVLLIVFNLIIPSVKFDEDVYSMSVNLVMSIDLLLVLHVLFVTIRNVTSFYFILIKK